MAVTVIMVVVMAVTVVMVRVIVWHGRRWRPRGAEVKGRLTDWRVGPGKRERYRPDVGVSERGAGSEISDTLGVYGRRAGVLVSLSAACLAGLPWDTGKIGAHTLAPKSCFSSQWATAICAGKTLEY
jgi:hypothetical protein